MKEITVTECGVSATIERHTFGSGSPHIFFTGGVHGNEVTGIWVARRLADFFAANPPVKGTVSVMPQVNPAATRCMQRRNPFDGSDLNRIFPGDPDGTMGQRLADAVWRETADADILVDLHCCGQHGLPYILSIYGESREVRELVRQITLPTAIHSEGTSGQLFTEAVRRRRQAACIIELPSGVCGGAVNVQVGEQCLAALLDMLRARGVVSGAVEGDEPAFYGRLLDAEAPRAGLWSPAVRKGESVSAGQVIGMVDGEPVAAPAEGFVMSVMPCAYLMPGDTWVMTYIQPEA